MQALLVGVDGVARAVLAQQSAMAGYAATNAEPSLAALKTLSAEGRRFDAAVFACASGRLTQVLLASLAYELLSDRGTLVVVDRLQPDADTFFRNGRQGFIKSFLLNTIDRCGFDAEEQFALDEDAGQPEGSDFPSSALTVLRFRKSMRRWRVVDGALCDIEKIQALFAEVFHHEMSHALRRWKYGDGRGDSVIAYSGDRLAAHYGTLSRRVLFKGVPKLAAQVCDVMVTPGERGSLTRKGPFFLTAATMAEYFLLSHDVGFGFPNQRAMKVAERLDLYHKVDQLASVYWPLRTAFPHLSSRVRSLSLPEDAAAVNALWADMAKDASAYIIGVRDAAFLRQRYVEHPEHDYQLYLVARRLSRRPLGVFVIRRGDNDEFELLDLIAPLSAFETVIEQARRVCMRQRGKRLYCWISAHLADRVRGSDGEVHALDVCIPTSIWGPGPPIGELRERWWLMGGDTDFR